MTHSLCVAKRLYYSKKLCEYKSNAKSTWKLLNDLISKKKSKGKLPSFFKSDEEQIPYYRKLTLHEIKVLEINANLMANEFRMNKINAKEEVKFHNKGN